jgi:hypothetical protein
MRELLVEKVKCTDLTYAAHKEELKRLINYNNRSVGEVDFGR